MASTEADKGFPAAVVAIQRRQIRSFSHAERFEKRSTPQRPLECRNRRSVIHDCFDRIRLVTQFKSRDKVRLKTPGAAISAL